MKPSASVARRWSFLANVLAHGLTIFVTSLAIGLAASETHAADGAPRDIEWRDAVAPDRYFSIRFPGAYQMFSDTAKTESGHEGTTAGVRGAVPGPFGGANNFVASCIVAPGDDRKPNERIKDVIERWEQLTDLQYRKPIELDGNPGVEFQLADDVKVLRARAYATRDRTCTVLVFWKPYSKPSDADLATFFDSFKLLAR